MITLPHRLDRTIVVEAPQAAVFQYFTDSARWAAWWGAGSSIDARPGGRVFIRYPNGVEAAGEVVEMEAPSRIVFTFGYLTGKPVGPGASLVTIRLEPAARGTRLVLMPGIRLRREGEARHCQGTVIAEWVASAADGQPRGRGTNVFTLDAQGRIEAVVGFWR